MGSADCSIEDLACPISASGHRGGSARGVGCVLGAFAPFAPGGAFRGSPRPPWMAASIQVAPRFRCLVGPVGLRPPAGRALPFLWVLMYKRKVFKTSNILAQPSAQVSKDRRAGGQQMAVR